MEQLTREIGRGFSNGYRQVQTIKSASRHETKPAERRLAASAVMALSTALQELGLRYRSAQNHYLTRMCFSIVLLLLIILLLLYIIQLR